MATITRRASMAGMVGLAAGAALPRASFGAAQSAPPQAPIPPEGIGRRIRHLGYSDRRRQARHGADHAEPRPPLCRPHVHRRRYRARRLEPAGRSSRCICSCTAPNTRTHHMQVANDLMLLGNGANIVRMQSYDSGRGYFENTLADSLDQPPIVPFRALHPRHLAARTSRAKSPSWRCPASASTGCGGPADAMPISRRISTASPTRSSCIVDVQNTMKPEIVSRWWLPGMNRAGGETNPAPQGKRFALHHMIVAGNRGYAGWRDGGFTIHDVSDPRAPKLLSHINWSPPFPGGTHTRTAVARPQARRRRR